MSQNILIQHSVNHVEILLTHSKIAHLLNTYYKQIFEFYVILQKTEPEKTILIAKYNKSDPVERKQKQRRIIRSPNSLFLLQFISRDDIIYCLGLNQSESDFDQHEEDEETVDLEEHFRDRDDKRPSQMNVEEREFQEKDKQSQYIETQQNKRQSSYHRIESTLSYKKKLMGNQYSQYGKQISRVPSQAMSLRQPIEKQTQTHHIIEFILIELDKQKVFINYLPHNNIDKVLKAFNENLMMQKVKPRKHLYQLISKQRQKINLSKIRVEAALKKFKQGKGIVNKKHKIENTQRKKIIQEQLKQHSEGNSDYLSQYSPTNLNINNMGVDESQKDEIVDEASIVEDIKYEIKVMDQTKPKEQIIQINAEEIDLKQNSNNTISNKEIQIDKIDNDKQEIAKYKILKKKKTNSFILKPSQFYSESNQDDNEFLKDRQSKRKLSFQIQTAILEYNKKRKSISNTNIPSTEKTPNQTYLDANNNPISNKEIN